MYIYDHPQWPCFQWDHSVLITALSAFRHQQGLFLGHIRSLGFSVQTEASFHYLTEEITQSADIEGEVLSAPQVRSSLARRLGLDIAGLPEPSRDVDGYVEIMLDATEHFDKPLTQERLLSWHAALFPTGYSGLTRIHVANWRTDEDGPMQVISGPIGKETVHFEAPEAHRIPKEIEKFLEWFNTVQQDLDPVLKAGIAHLWFVTLHPFDDGNGRIARVIGEMALARSEKCSKRFYSLSKQVRQDRQTYYTILEDTQKSDELDITNWLEWFLRCLNRSLIQAEIALNVVLNRTKFLNKYPSDAFNNRQNKIISRLLEGNFEGKLTSTKWAKLAKCSQDTASCDIKELIEQGILEKQGEGRSTHYVLCMD